MAAADGGAPGDGGPPPRAPPPPPPPPPRSPPPRRPTPRSSSGAAPILPRRLESVAKGAALASCRGFGFFLDEEGQVKKKPQVDDFIELCDKAYTRQEILVMEKKILNKMEWNLTVPTPYVFLVRFAKAAGSGDKELERMVFFLAELALMDYRVVTFSLSMVAASAVYAARCTLKKSPLWTPTLKHHTGFDEPQLVNSLSGCHAEAPEGKLKTVCKKYASEQFGSVSLHPPAAAPGFP